MRVGRTSHISVAIAEGRKAAGLSQQALADRLGVSRKWVSELERGNPDAEVGLVIRALNETGAVLTLRVRGGAVAMPAIDPVGRSQLDIVEELARLDQPPRKRIAKPVA